MFFVAVRTNVNFAVVATFLVHNDDCSTIAEALEVVQNWNVLWKPTYFLVDWYKSERKSVAKCFPGYFILQFPFICLHFKAPLCKQCLIVIVWRPLERFFGP